MDGTFNKKGLIENTVEVNIYHQEYRKRTEINIIEEQKVWCYCSGIFCVIYNCITVTCDIILTPNPESKNEK